MLPEHIQIQLKENARDTLAKFADAPPIPEIAKTINAFLNTKGGTLYCGVSEEGKVVGVNSPGAIEEKLYQYLQDKLSPSAVFSISKEAQNGKEILCIDVPEGQDKPYVLDGAVYTRSGDKTKPVDTTKLRQMIQKESTETTRWERRQSIGVEPDDLFATEIDLAIKEIQSIQRLKLESADPTYVLRELAVLRGADITNAGVLLFAEKPARYHPQTRARFIQYEGEKVSDHYIHDESVEGPLVQVLDQLYKLIERQTPLSIRFKNSSLRSESSSLYPPKAVREGLVNALVHRDYGPFNSTITVSLFPDRLEIWNTGALPPGIKIGDLVKDHPSKPFNPDIAHAFWARGLMDKIGRGTQRVLIACREHKIPAPEWKEVNGGIQITLYNQYVKNHPEKTLNERQITLLESIEIGDEIESGEFQERFAKDVSDRQVRRDLSELEQMDFLLRHGRGKNTVYRRTTRPFRT